MEYWAQQDNAEGIFQCFSQGLEVFDLSQPYPCNLAATFHSALDTMIWTQMQVLCYQLPTIANSTNTKQEKGLLHCKDAAVHVEQAILLSPEVIATIRPSHGDQGHLLATREQHGGLY